MIAMKYFKFYEIHIRAMYEYFNLSLGNGRICNFTYFILILFGWSSNQVRID